MSRHPEIKWAQREDKVYLTVLLSDAKNPKVNLDPEGVFTFSGSAGAENHLYELKLDLHDKVNVEESKINIGVRNIFCVLEKAEKKWWNRLLRGDGKVPHYVKVDWDKWVDEDEETGPGDVDLGGMDFSKFGDMGGMGGMMGGMGGMGGMEGLGGMMGGMGGMGGMGDEADFDESDDEADEVKKPEKADESEPEESMASKGEGEGKSEAAPTS